MNSSKVAGYLFALGAGATWGTTGVLSIALFHGGQDITGIGFWRVSLGVAGLLLYGLFFHREIFKVDLKGFLLIFGVERSFIVAVSSRSPTRSPSPGPVWRARPRSCTSHPSW